MTEGKSEQPNAEPKGPRHIPVPDDWFDDLEPDQLDYDSEWEDHLEELPADTIRSTTMGRGCLVSWRCRNFPEKNELPGCESTCLWTRDDGKARPNCFGFFRGAEVVSEGELLHAPVLKNCESCVEKRYCADETSRRRQGEE